MSWPHQTLIQKTLQFHVFLAPNHNSHCTWNEGGRNWRHNGPNRYMREILTNLLAVPFIYVLNHSGPVFSSAVNLAARRGQFEYSVVVCDKKCCVWAVGSSAAKVFPRCRNGLTSWSVVSTHNCLGDFFQVPSCDEAVIFICLQADISRGNKRVGIAECL